MRNRHGKPPGRDQALPPEAAPRPGRAAPTERVPQPRVGVAVDAHLPPAGFGKTTLLAEWLADTGTDRSVAWLSLDEGDRQPASYWTYLITALQAVIPGAGAGALQLLQSSQPPIETVLVTVLNELRRAGRPLPGARRLPPGRRPRPPGRDDVPARAPPAPGAPGGQHPRGPGTAPGPSAGTRRAGRGPGGWPALHPRRGGGLPQRRHRARSGGERHRDPGGTHRGLDRRPPAGRAVDAGTRRRRRLHRRFRGGRPAHRRLPRRRGPGPSARRRPRPPGPDLHPRPAERPDEHPERVAALHRRANQWYERDGEPSQAIRHALAAGDVERAAGSSSWRSRNCAGAGRRRPSGAGSTPSPTRWSASGRCSRWASSGR